MALNVTKEINSLKQMSVPQLRERYAEVFGEGTNVRHKERLIRRIIWRMQANVEGDLSERARRRAEELANDADLRITAPRKTREPVVQPSGNEGHSDDRLPTPGTIITRQYKGRQLEVKVLASGFEFDGAMYKSLSAIAKTVTGTHWNGYHFFGMHRPRGES